MTRKRIGDSLSRPLALRGIQAQERAVGVSLNYLREVARWTPGLVLKLGLLAPLGNHRRHAPAEVLHLARVQATLAEDCGACVQIAVNLARKDGVSPELLRAVVRRRPEDLPERNAIVYRFIAAVLADDVEQEEWRGRVRRDLGNAALIEISLAVALASFFPRFKRGLGAAQSCGLHPVHV